MCYVEAKCSSSDPDSNIIYVNNSVTITTSKKTWLAPEYIYIQMQKSVIQGTCSIVINFLIYN